MGCAELPSVEVPELGLKWQQNHLEKSTKQPVPSQASGRQRTALRATVQWGGLRRSPSWYVTV